MATRNTGPVKPPVLDLEAQKTGTRASTPGGSTSTQTGADNKTSSKNTAGRKPETAKPAARSFLSSELVLPVSTGVIGALAGAAIAYGVAMTGFWPQPEPAATPADLARVEGDITSIRSSLTAQNNQLATQADKLETLSTTSGDMSADVAATIETLRKEIAAISAQQQPEAPDLSPLQTQIDELETMVSAIASGVSADDAPQIAEQLSGITTALEDLTQRIANTEQAMQQNQAEIETTRQQITELTATAQSNASATEDTQPQLQLSLALSGLDAAIHTGKPFAAELQVLSQALPDIDIPQTLIDASASGLPAPDDVTIAFARVIPDMLAAKPVDENADWAQSLINRAQAVLALRPNTASGDETPQALIANIETALAREDFATAHESMMALPQAMRTESGALADQIADLASAEEFTSTARAMALNPQPVADGDENS